MTRHDTLHAAFMITFLVTFAAGAPARAAQEKRSDTQGVKETEKFVKEGDDLTHKVGEAKAQVESTLTAYNTLVSGPSKNMKKDYDRLLKELKNMDEKAADARTQAGEMEEAGKTYFAGRATTIAAIQDPQLKAQAEQRLKESQKQHADVLSSLRSAGQSLDPIRKDLNDQIKFLGSDLNPGAAATLAPKAKELNERGRTNFAKADEAINAANTYFNSMRPSK
jgi:hypothetical protein